MEASRARLNSGGAAGGAAAGTWPRPLESLYLGGQGDLGIMEKIMEATMLFRGGQGDLGIMEKIMEATILFRGGSGGT